MPFERGTVNGVNLRCLLGAMDVAKSLSSNDVTSHLEGVLTIVLPIFSTEISL